MTWNGGTAARAATVSWAGGTGWVGTIGAYAARRPPHVSGGRPPSRKTERRRPSEQARDQGLGLEAVAAAAGVLVRAGLLVGARLVVGARVLVGHRVLVRDGVLVGDRVLVGVLGRPPVPAAFRAAAEQAGQQATAATVVALVGGDLVGGSLVGLLVVGGNILV